MKELSKLGVEAVLAGKALPSELLVGESLTKYFARLYLHTKDSRDEQLAQRDAQIAALTDENVALKDAVKTHSESVHFCELCGKDDPCATDDVCMVLDEIPATDAAANALRAEGVEMFGQWQRELAIKATGEVRCAYVGSVKDAITFANQLREGK